MAAADVALGFIGLGEQGAPLALNLQAAGYAPVVFDARRQALLPFSEAGASIAGSVDEVGHRAKVVLVCVNDGAQLADVLGGAGGGLLGSMPAGGVIVIHSTVSAALVEQNAGIAARLGIAIVDAPLTGGAEGARNKSVVYFVGGDADALERCRPILEVSARKIIRAGPVGAGLRAKLVHQLVLCGNLMAARDGWLLGRSAGLDDGIIIDVLQSGAAQSRVGERLPRSAWSDHVLELFQKDISLCLELGKEHALELRTASFIEDELGTQRREEREGSTHP